MIGRKLSHYQVVNKCLAKDPAERYQSIKEVVVDLRAVRRELESGAKVPVAAARRNPWLYVGGLAIAIVAAGAVYLMMRAATEEPAAVTPSRPSVAVLYFENVSGDPELDWLRTGLTDMLVTDLSQSPNMSVLSTDRLYQILKDMNRLDERVTSLEVVQEVAEKGHAEKALLGSFMKAGDNIRINVRVQDVATGEKLLELYPDNIGGRNRLALCYRIFERFEESMFHFEEYRRRKGAFVGAFNNLAICYSSLGQFERTALFPTEKEKRRHHHLLGELALMRGETESAIKELEVAQSLLSPRGVPGTGLLRSAPHVPIWYSFARAHYESGNDKEAAKGFRTISESSTEHIPWPIPYVRSFYFLGKIHESRGDMNGARKHYQRFVDFWGEGDMNREWVEEAKGKIGF